MGAGAVAGLVREEGSGGTRSAGGGRAMAEHLSSRDPYCLQGVCACGCVCGVGGGWGEGRGGGLAGQQSRELVKLPITLNPPLEAQRGENSENVTLSPQKGSSEGRDFRGWGSGF